MTTAPISQYQIELLARARVRIARSRVQYGEKVAYPDDMQLMLDLTAQIESLTLALEMASSLSDYRDLWQEALKWAEKWHGACQTIMTMAGLSSAGSPEELLSEFQDWLTASAPPHSPAAITEAADK